MIVAVDDFIKDEVLLKEIADNEASIFSDPGVYYFWDGWWNSPANTVKKRLIEYVWRYHSPLYESISISGIEYWTGIQTANPDLGFKDHLVPHFDKDEAWFEKTNEIKSPVIGTVYYPAGQEFEGGSLLVYSNGFDKEPEVIHAKPNRLIIFDAGTVIHKVDTVTSGTRKAIAINLWKDIPYSEEVGAFAKE